MKQSHNIQANTTTEKLAELAKSNNPDICRQIAQHPNTSLETLKELFIYFPKEVLENPLLDLFLLENPSFFQDLYHVNPDCFYAELPLFYLEWGANNSDYHIRCSVAHSNSTPMFILEKLALDEDSTVRSAVAGNTKISTKLSKQLSKDKHERVTKILAANYKISQEILAFLATNKLNEIRLTVARNINTANYTLEQLANDKLNEIRLAVANNINTPNSVLEKLANDKLNEIRLAVANNINTPNSVLEKLANDKLNEIRLAVAKNINTPNSVLEKLANDKDISVISSVASNPHINLNLLQELVKVATNENCNMCLIFSIFYNKNATQELKEQLYFFYRDNFTNTLYMNGSSVDFLLNFKFLISAIDIEMNRLKWSKDMVRNHLKEKYGKRSRLYLKDSQIIEFWQYLLNLPTPDLS